MGEVLNLSQAINFSKKLKSRGKTIILAGGCFDLIHKGHLIYLDNAKHLGNVLFVMLESDQNVKRLKGNHRPINNQKKRAKQLLLIASVDYVVSLPPLNTNEEYFKVSKNLSPDIIAITEGDPRQKEKQKQAEMVGGRVEVVTKYLKNYSTTGLLSRELK